MGHGRGGSDEELHGYLVDIRDVARQELSQILGRLGLGEEVACQQGISRRGKELAPSPYALICDRVDLLERMCEYRIGETGTGSDG